MGENSNHIYVIRWEPDGIQGKGSKVRRGCHEEHFFLGRPGPLDGLYDGFLGLAKSERHGHDVDLPVVDAVINGLLQSPAILLEVNVAVPSEPRRARDLDEH